MDLLFSKQKLPFRPLLMSLVLQRASWQILHGIMTYLLKDDITSEICPVSALDFLTALTKSPKLWQGRDKAIPKHHHAEDILQLTSNQALSMINYIVEEAKTGDPDTWRGKMESRLQLLLKCLRESSAAAATKTLLSRSASSSDDHAHCRELLLMIYMSMPCSAQEHADALPAGSCPDRNCPSAVDAVSHCVLSALAATPARLKDWTRRSSDLELCARKLAATHPALVLRQMPMLAGCLKGRAQYEWGVLRARGHLALFGQVLGLMELLRPRIFERRDALRDLLDSYFDLMRFHGHSKDLSGLIGRVVAFIQGWMTKDVDAASRYLQEHGGVLNDIQFVQPSVRPLLSSVSLPVSEQSCSSELLVGTVTPPVPESYPQHWPQLKAALQAADNLAALQELDHLTSRRPQWLGDVSHHLLNSVVSSSGAVRSLALMLIVRWLKQEPRAAGEALPAVLACLDSDNGDVVGSVLERLSDLVAVMQEYAKLILTRVFRLGMKSTTNTTANITKTVGLLSLQYGC